LWLRINNKNTHGIGCTLSSAIACDLAKGMDLEVLIQLWKEYVSCELRAMIDIETGIGLINYIWNIHDE
jgi:hydroxymethylpyrimidine/phosphomethylpyrimidine kinase